MKAVSDSRDLEMGKLAAYEYEQVTNDLADYTSSVKRFYSRASIVSPLKPMSIYLQIRFDDILKNSTIDDPKIQKSLRSFVSKSLANQIDGLVI